MKIMASGPITLWQIDGETMETVTDFIFLGSKVTAGGDCSHEIKRHLFLGRKAMTNLDSILKSRDITLTTKVHLVKAMISPIVMHGCKCWTIKKAECRRIDAFELQCWKRLLRVPWTAKSQCCKESRKSTLNIHWKDWCWSRNSNTLATYAKSWLIVKDPDHGKNWRQKEKGMTEDEMVGWHHQLNGHEFDQSQGAGNGQGSLVCWSPWGSKESDMTEWLNPRSEVVVKFCVIYVSNNIIHLSIPSELKLFSHIGFFVTPWIIAC